MKILRVGDVHAKRSNLKESKALMKFVLDKALEFNVDRLELLGDLTDTHSVIQLEVQEFWDKWLLRLACEDFSTFVLVGNHDMSGSYNSTYSSLSVFKYIEEFQNEIKIIDKPYVRDKYGYLPYIHDNEEFIEEANKLAKLGATVLVSHPNYAGAVYDNGAPIASGVDPDRLDPRFLHLIGGHIHTQLEMGRVWYTGNPRWLTKSCANKQKGIWLCTHDETGKMTSKEFLSTAEVCTPIVSLTWKEGEERPEVPKNSNVNIELIGSSDWVSEQKKELVGVSISSKLTDIKKSKVRKSGKSLHEFLSKHYQAEPEKRQKLLNYMEGLHLV